MAKTISIPVEDLNNTFSNVTTFAASATINFRDIIVNDMTINLVQDPKTSHDPQVKSGGKPPPTLSAGPRDIRLIYVLTFLTVAVLGVLVWLAVVDPTYRPRLFDMRIWAFGALVGGLASLLWTRFSLPPDA